jgi:hypothetical protein
MVTVSEAAGYSGKNRSQISRDCRNRRFPTNGMQWRDLRVCLWSVLVAAARDLSKCAYRYHRQPGVEAYEIVDIARGLCPAVGGLRPGKVSPACSQAERLVLKLKQTRDDLSEEKLNSEDGRLLLRTLNMAVGLERGLRRLADL